MEGLSIAVIGANGVGKSQFIRTATSLPPSSKPLPPSPEPKPMTTRIVVDNVPYTVALFELDLQYFESEYFGGQYRQVKWPKQMNGTILPRVHGVLFLYDVMNRESINYLPETLSKSYRSFLRGGSKACTISLGYLWTKLKGNRCSCEFVAAGCSCGYQMR